MYRCTECRTEYEERPDYCECGNDSFELVPDDYAEDAAEYADYNTDYRQPETVLTPEKAAEIEAEKIEKTKSLIAAGVILILCVLVFLMPPHRKPKIAQNTAQKTEKTVQLPSAAAFWDDTVPSAYRKKDPYANLPLLNSRLSSISPVLREYLVNIGRTLNNGWQTSFIKGSGSCKVQLVINKEGGLNAKNIISSTGNQDLDDSVSLLLTNTTGFNIPPEDYKGEKIYILFSIDDNGHSKVSYPSK